LNESKQEQVRKKFTKQQNLFVFGDLVIDKNNPAFDAFLRFHFLSFGKPLQTRSLVV
jgi:hypothetical protein